MRVPYYIGDLKQDPHVENCPCACAEIDRWTQPGGSAMFLIWVP